MRRKKKEVTALVTMSQNTKQAVTNYTGGLFSDIDFQGLNMIINKITSNTEGLSDSMRVAASNFADDWDKLVVRRLDEKEHRLSELQGFFKLKSRYYSAIHNQFEPQGHYCNGSYVKSEHGIVHAVLRVFESNAKWHKYIDGLQKLIADYQALQEQIEELQVDEDDIGVDRADVTYEELVDLTKKQSFVSARADLKISQLKFAFCKNFGTFIRKLQADPTIKEFIADLDNQVRQAVNARAIVHEKSSLVKLSINFGGTDLLKALKDLHDFQESL